LSQNFDVFCLNFVNNFVVLDILGKCFKEIPA